MGGGGREALREVCIALQAHAPQRAASRYGAKQCIHRSGQEKVPGTNKLQDRMKELIRKIDEFEHGISDTFFNDACTVPFLLLPGNSNF